jgi:hypothetical protein
VANRPGKSNGNSARVDEAIKRLRDAYREGRRLLRECPFGKTYGQGLIIQKAAEVGTNQDKLRKLRSFAEPEEGYTQQELQELFKLCRQHRRVIGFSIVVKFLTIGEKTQRAKFQRRAIREGWSLARVEQELVKRFGRRHPGGRRPRIPHTLKGFLADLDTRAFTLLRLINEVQKASGQDRHRICWTDLPSCVQADLAKVKEDISRLRTGIVGHLWDHLPPAQPRKWKFRFRAGLVRLRPGRRSVIKRLGLWIG